LENKSSKNRHSLQYFQFGKNWKRFLSNLSERQIIEAEISLKNILGWNDLNGKTFLDVGSGSGLFSLAAVRLGAQEVLSIEADPICVACTRDLKKKYYPDAKKWRIGEGSVLNPFF